MYNFFYKILGKGEKYVGYGSKLFMIRDYLEDFKDRDDQIVMFTDAYDILFYKNKSEIFGLFMEFNANIVFGAEEFLTPVIEARQKYPKVGKKGRYSVFDMVTIFIAS